METDTKLLRPFNDLVYTDLEDMSQQEHDAYLARVKTDNGDTLENVETIQVLRVNDEEVSLSYYVYDDWKFERIRRVTGYLTGTLDRWNDSKRAEERDRVKHCCE